MALGPCARKRCHDLSSPEAGPYCSIECKLLDAATCKLPPYGWWCSREKDHEGPCAARRHPDKSPVHPRVLLERAEIKYLDANDWILYAGAGPDSDKCCAPPGEPNNRMTLDEAVIEQKRRDEVEEQRRREER